MAKENTDVVFLKVDVELLDDLAAEYEISCMPTFIFLKQGSKVCGIGPRTRRWG